MLRTTLVLLLTITLAFGQTKVKEGDQTTGALPTSQGGVPPGGAPDEVLTKLSGSDFHYDWMPAAAGGLDGSIADQQIAFGVGPNTIGGSDNFKLVDSTKQLFLGASPYQITITSSSSTQRIVASGGVGAFDISTARLLFTSDTNGTSIIDVARATDTSPSGNFEIFRTHAGTALWNVDYSGTLITGIIPWARITGVPAFELGLTASKSITRTGDDFALTNDSATPGNSKYYGTDSGGVRGFFNLPAVGGGGTVTDFSAGDLSPLFTTTEATTTTTPALSFVLSNAAAHSYFGNNTGSSGAPGFHVIDYSELSGTPTIPSNISGLHYVTTQAESGLSNEFSLGSLGNGILVNSVGAGVSTPAIAIVDSPLNYVSGTGHLQINGAALTKNDDTNVTLTLGGSPTTALVNAASLTLGWSGTLAQSRGGFGKSSASVTDGQIPIGKTSDGSWNFNTITAGSNVTVTNGAGSITIAASGAGGGTPGGSNTQVQFNDSSAFGGDSGLTWDKTNDKLTLLRDDAITASIYDNLKLVHTSTGTAAANFGVGIEYLLEDAANSIISAGHSDVAWSNAGASQSAYWDFFLIGSGGVDRRMRLWAEGTTGASLSLGYTSPTAPGAGYADLKTGVKINGTAVFEGGTTGQVLKKNSNTNYDFGWTSSGGGSIVRTIRGTWQDLSGAALTTGASVGVATAGYGGTITGYNISANTGTCTIKTWKKATGTAIPTVSDNISTSGVALSTGTHVRSSTTSDFTTTTVTAGDMFIFNLSAVASASWVVFELEITSP